MTKTKASTAASRVGVRVNAVLDKIEKIADVTVSNIEAEANKTLNKFGAVETSVVGGLKECNDALDAILFGDNGGPGLDESATFLVSSAEPGTRAAPTAAPVDTSGAVDASSDPNK